MGGAGEQAGLSLLYRELWRLAKGKRQQLVAACALLILAQLILLAVPYVAGKAINVLQAGGTQRLGEAGLWLSGAVLLAVGCWAFHGPGRVLERNVSLHVRRTLAMSLVGRLFSLPLAWHEANHSGESAHRVQQSTLAIASFAQSQYIYLNSAVRLVGPVAALWYLDAAVGIACVIGFGVITVSVLAFDRRMIRLARAENAADRRYAAAMVDALGNTGTIYSLRQARSVLTMLERRLLEVFEPLKRAIVVNETKWCVVDLATRTLSAALVALFAWQTFQRAGGVSTGAGTGLMLGSLYMVWEYSSQAGSVVASIAQHFQSFARQHADYAAAGAIQDAMPIASGKHDVDRANVWRRLDLQHVTFRHARHRAPGPSLDNVCLTLERGKRYALIGNSGSGKSTLLRILAGLYTPDRAILRFDGGSAEADTAAIAASLRCASTLIPQDAEVFAGSVAQNLGMAETTCGAVDPQRYAHALHIAQAGFVDTTTAGLEAEVAERAANWSGGQRSRIALARGVLAAQGSALVLLDEPTAHLDPITESAVYSALFAEFPDACIVSSVHRLHLLERFDEVLFMDQGRLIAQAPAHILALTLPQFRALAVPSSPGTPAAAA
jgi:ATP-binding cassette, subfamily B, bacterial